MITFPRLVGWRWRIRGACWTICAGLALASPGLAAGATPPARVLFVGNSFTYYNDGLHKHVGNFLRASGSYQRQQMRLRMLTLSGGKLVEHAGGIAALVQPDDWDLVVMHGHSTAMLSEDGASAFARAAAHYARHIRNNGARPAFLMTWAYRDEPQMLTLIRKGYRDIGRLLDAKVIPVGLAFAAARREHPEINLYKADLARYNADGKPVYRKPVKHPSRAGTYLAAAVVVASVFEESPVGSRYRAGLDPTKAAALQQVAADTVARFN